jgi:hypothetical protein
MGSFKKPSTNFKMQDGRGNSTFYEDNVFGDLDDARTSLSSNIFAPKSFKPDQVSSRPSLFDRNILTSPVKATKMTESPLAYSLSSVPRTTI